jgi:4-alpha-glucanotransferase
MTRTVPTGRTAGLLLPLFSMPSSRSWGIGEILDLIPMAAWAREAGLGVLQLLPINEMAAGQTSPYSATSAMAIDPIFISLHAVEDFVALGGEPRLDLGDQIAIRGARTASRVEYAPIRRAKLNALRMAFSYFWDTEWVRGTARAGSFAAFCNWEDYWLADYALFRALSDRFDNRPWSDWETEYRVRDPETLELARKDLETEILFHQYMQWLADDQWETARERAAPVALFGDFPFMVSADSADVWSRQHLFRFDATVGVPPDAFSATGQDWGLPVYHWDAMAEDKYQWLRDRVRRTARLFDGYRIDHVVGFYRTYSRPVGQKQGTFDPPNEAEQLAQGERLMSIFLEGSARVVAEDLGSVPEFVRQSLTRLGIAGYKVFRWERAWNEPGQPYHDPASYPVLAVATTGTHDTEPVAAWWDDATVEERRAVAAVASLKSLQGVDDVAALPFSRTLLDDILRSLFACPADLLVLPVQDVFGWRDRINTPATVTDGNWTWRLPWLADRMADEPEARARATVLKTLATGSKRTTE